jgi:hypothetical protein
MYSFIVKDCIKDVEILQWLLSFLKDVSVAPFDVDKDQKEDLLFEGIPMTGDFCMQLFLYTELELEEKKLAAGINGKFKTDVLLSDDSDNPFSWIQIKENGEEKVVYQRVDEQDEDLFLIKHDD